jgi:hypothetical protein
LGGADLLRIGRGPKTGPDLETLAVTRLVGLALRLAFTLAVSTTTSTVLLYIAVSGHKKPHTVP